MAEKQFKLKFDGANAKAVDEYLEYSRYLFSFFFSPVRFELNRKNSVRDGRPISIVTSDFH